MSTVVFSPALSAMSTPSRTDPLPLPLPPPSSYVDSRAESFFADVHTPPSPPKRTMTTPPPRGGSQSPRPPPRQDSAGYTAVQRHLTPSPYAHHALSLHVHSQSERGPKTKSPSPMIQPRQHRPMSAATEPLDSTSPFQAPRSAPSMPLPTLAPMIIHPPSIATESALSSPASSTRGLLLTPPLSPSRASTLTATHTSITSTVVFPLLNRPMSVPPSIRPVMSPLRYQQILESFQSCYMSHLRQIRFHQYALAFSLFNLLLSYVLVSIQSLRKADLPAILVYMTVSALFSLVATINWHATYASQLRSMDAIATELNRKVMQEDGGLDGEEDEAIHVDVQHGRQQARRSIWLPPSDTTLDAMWSVARDPVVKSNVVVNITIHGPVSLLMAYSSIGAGPGAPGAADVEAPLSPTGLSGTTITGAPSPQRPPRPSPDNADASDLVAKSNVIKFVELPPPVTGIMRSSVMSHLSDGQLLGPHPPLTTHHRPPTVKSPKIAHASPRRPSTGSDIDSHKPQPRYSPASNPVLGGRRPSLVSLLNEGPLVPTQYPKAPTMPLPPPSSKPESPPSGTPLEPAASGAGSSVGLLGLGSYGAVADRRPSNASSNSSNLPPQFRHLFASLDQPLDRRPSFALLPPAKSLRPPLLGDLDLGPSRLLEAIEEASSSLEQANPTGAKGRSDTTATSLVKGDSFVALYGTTGNVPPMTTRSSPSVFPAQLRMGRWADESESKGQSQHSNEDEKTAHTRRQRELVRLQEELKQLERDVAREDT